MALSTSIKFGPSLPQVQDAHVLILPCRIEQSAEQCPALLPLATCQMYRKDKKQCSSQGDKKQE